MSFCPQGNDVRIILGQFDQNMAAKVFCCVSKTLATALCLWGGFTKLFLRLVLTAWSERNIGLEAVVGSRSVIFTALSSLRGAKPPGLRTVQSWEELGTSVDQTYWLIPGLSPVG